MTLHTVIENNEGNRYVLLPHLPLAMAQSAVEGLAPYVNNDVSFTIRESRRDDAAFNKE